MGAQRCGGSYHRRAYPALLSCVLPLVVVHKSAWPTCGLETYRLQQRPGAFSVAVGYGISAHVRECLDGQCGIKSAHGWKG